MYFVENGEVKMLDILMRHEARGHPETGVDQAIV